MKKYESEINFKESVREAVDRVHCKIDNKIWMDHTLMVYIISIVLTVAGVIIVLNIQCT